MSKNENKATEANEAIQDQTLEDLSGGYIFDTGELDGGDESPWEVIDDKDGSVLLTYKDSADAMDAAEALGVSDDEISWGDVLHLRSGGRLNS